MGKKIEDTRLLVEIAHMYYDDDMTQQKISKQLNMSRSLVSKLLTKAKQMGIVEVTIRDEGMHPFRDLEEKVKKAFELRDVIIVNAKKSNEPRKRIGMEAGKHLARKIANSKCVAVAAGRTVKEIAMNFSSTVPFSDVTFVPMTGGLGIESQEISSNTLCEYFAHGCGANSLRLHAPVTVDSKEAKEVLMNQHYIKTVFDQAKKADLAVVGIGNSNQCYEFTEAYLHGLNPDDLKAIKDDMAGNISFNYFDRNGDVIDCQWNRQMMGLTIEDIKKIPEVVCACYETEKAESLYIALFEEWIDTIILDVDVAKKILQYHAKHLEGKM